MCSIKKDNFFNKTRNMQLLFNIYFIFNIFIFCGYYIYTCVNISLFFETSFIVELRVDSFSSIFFYHINIVWNLRPFS